MNSRRGTHYCVSFGVIFSSDGDGKVGGDCSCYDINSRGRPRLCKLAAYHELMQSDQAALASICGILP